MTSTPSKHQEVHERNGCKKFFIFFERIFILFEKKIIFFEKKIIFFEKKLYFLKKKYGKTLADVKCAIFYNPDKRVEHEPWM